MKKRRRVVLEYKEEKGEVFQNMKKGEGEVGRQQGPGEGKEGLGDCVLTVQRRLFGSLRKLGIVSLPALYADTYSSLHL